MKLFINCKKAAIVCDKAQYADAGRWEKLKLKFHHWYCSRCKAHSQKNQKLSKLISDAKLKTMPQDLKDHLQEMVVEQKDDQN